jgi:hypothetical protein
VSEFSNKRMGMDISSLRESGAAVTPQLPATETRVQGARSSGGSLKHLLIS